MITPTSSSTSSFVNPAYLPSETILEVGHVNNENNIAFMKLIKNYCNFSTIHKSHEAAFRLLKLHNNGLLSENDSKIAIIYGKMAIKTGHTEACREYAIFLFNLLSPIIKQKHLLLKEITKVFTSYKIDKEIIDNITQFLNTSPEFIKTDLSQAYACPESITKNEFLRLSALVTKNDLLAKWDLAHLFLDFNYKRINNEEEAQEELSLIYNELVNLGLNPPSFITQFQKIMMEFFGILYEKNTYSAIDQLHDLTKKNHIGAFLTLGCIYATGASGEKNFEIDKIYFNRASIIEGNKLREECLKSFTKV